MSTTPDHNTQFGQKIGVDDVSPPKAARGPQADEQGEVDTDPNTRTRVRFSIPVKAPPPEEASFASEAGVRDDAGPAEMATIPEAPSVWDAREEGDDG
jgi:hypothetical protein